MTTGPLPPPKIVGRYALYAPIAEGGMASVHLARVHAALGFSLTVAIKRLLPAYAAIDRFVAMFIDEARLSSRVRHPNVVPVLDVVAEPGELFLVMDYVHGVTLAELLRLAREGGESMPPEIAASIVCDALEGLHAAHEAKSELGASLGVVHRDVSPDNILVGADGTARVLDFGVAKAHGRVQASTGGALKGKVQYMAPEQLSSGLASRASDVYSAAVVLWEALTGQRAFAAASEVDAVGIKLLGDIAPPSRLVPGLPAALDAIVARATHVVPEARYATARAMSVAVERVFPGAKAEVSEWVRRVAAPDLAARAALVALVERASPAPAIEPARRQAPSTGDTGDVWKQFAPSPKRRSR